MRFIDGRFLHSENKILFEIISNVSEPMAKLEKQLPVNADQG